MEWTNEQKLAIETNNCNLLVAAGAGSGKTAVLVERIVQKMLKDKIDIDRLLVVTFTNAAASEMRERIAKRLYDELEKDPSMQKQITLLGKANICTMHSFCLKVIRDNFFEVDLDPNFRVGDQTECELLKLEALDELMEENYESGNQEFEELINTYTGNREDNAIKEIILNIHNFIQSTPSPKEWLKEKCELYNLDNVTDFAETIWGKILVENFKEEVLNQIEELKLLEDELSDYPNYLLSIQDDIFKLQALYKNNNSWDECVSQIMNLEFERLKPCKEIDEELKKSVQETREKMKKRIIEYWKNNVFIFSSAEISVDMKRLYKILTSISNLVLQFDEKFTSKKREKNILDFNDIEHIALKLLTSKEEIRERYRNQFDEILIDEYQDSNLIQEELIKSISKNKVFMVGDVKQSIYRFRQARPDLFLKKYKSYGEDSEYGKKILLFKNFRSNENIINATNDIFKEIMSEELGEIDYTEDEFLKFGASYYPEKGAPAELHLIEKNTNEIDDDTIEERPQIEARVIANRIAELMEKEQIYDKDLKCMRKIEYRDIVILMRATTGYADIFVQELLEKNIPVYSDNQMGYFENTEVQIITALLKILDNPMQDIPLIAVMRSQIGNFNVDELTSIRLIDRSCSFYEAALKFVSSDAKIESNEKLSKKLKNFLDKINEWRDKASYLTIHDLLWLLYRETGYYYYVSLLPDGKKKITNLKLLLERAKTFESTTYRGLFNFLNYIDNIRASSGDLESGKLIGENENVVRIMSIHKSKGLEFPIVFLSGTSRKFNERDFQDKIILHQELGFGADIVKYEKRITYSTIPKLAIIQKAKREALSEEMRILYVAMTRAREKLIVTALANDTEKAYNEMSKKITSNSIANAKNFLDWIGKVVIGKNMSWNVKTWTAEDVRKLSYQQVEQRDEIFKYINKLTENIDFSDIDKILSWQYPYMEATKLPTKISISEIKRMQRQEEESNLEDLSLIEKPSFMDDKIETGASYGTRVHFILQNLDYQNPQIEEWIQDLLPSTKQLILKQFEVYKNTELFKRIKNSKQVYRETSFNLNVSANEIYHFEKNIEEEIMLQGIIDLYFIEDGKIVLVDFKTDSVQSSEELVKKYRVQLDYYKRALEKITGMKVKESLIYSMKLGKQVDILG